MSIIDAYASYLLDMDLHGVLGMYHFIPIEIKKYMVNDFIISSYILFGKSMCFDYYLKITY